MFCGFQNLYPDFCRVGVVLPARIRNTEGMTTNTTTTYRGYRIEGEYGAMSLYSPDGKYLELVDNDEDAWYRIDNIWEA